MLKNDSHRQYNERIEVIHFLNKNVSELIKAYDELTAKDHNMAKTK